MVSQLQFLATLSLVDYAAGEESVMADFAAGLRLRSAFENCSKRKEVRFLNQME